MTHRRGGPRQNVNLSSAEAAAKIHTLLSIQESANIPENITNHWICFEKYAVYSEANFFKKPTKTCILFGGRM